MSDAFDPFSCCRRQRRRQMRVFKDLGIPGPEPHFLFGNLTAFKDKMMCKQYQQWRDTYGETFGSVYTFQTNFCFLSRTAWQIDISVKTSVLCVVKLTQSAFILFSLGFFFFFLLVFISVSQFSQSLFLHLQVYLLIYFFRFCIYICIHSFHYWLINYPISPPSFVNSFLCIYQFIL